MDWPKIIWFASYGIVLLGLSGYGIHRYSMVYLFLKNFRRNPEPQERFENLPKITVQLPIFNELYVVRRLIDAVAKIDYPKELLQIQINDDSTDETQEICQEEAEKLREMGFEVEYLHRTDRTGFKAGALEYGLESATGEYIFILDADFVPEPEILHQMVHHFTDPKVGMIQTRWGHLNRRYSLLTRIQAMFLDGHLLVEQTARSRSGRFINFNGTAGIWRKCCIADAGGWQHDTLTEDLDLSYRAQLKGWKFVFLKDVVTPAELPVDMDGFKSQQHRWTKGSIQTCKKMLIPIWKGDVPLIVKLEATAHLTSNFAYLLLALLCFLVYPTKVSGDLSFNADLLLNLLIFFAASLSVVAFYTVSQIALYPKTWYRELIYLPLLLALGIGMSINNGKAVLEAVFNKESAFIRTPKYGIGKKKTTTWRGKRYAALKSMGLVFEVLFALYFTGLLTYSIMRGYWNSVPFLVLFQLGFIYVAWGSLSQMLPSSFFGIEKDRAAT